MNLIPGIFVETDGFMAVFKIIVEEEQCGFVSVLLFNQSLWTEKK